MDEEFDEETGERKPHGIIIAGKIFKYFIIGIVVGMFTVLMVRSCRRQAPGEMKYFVWDSYSIELYEKNPDDFTVLELQEYNTNDIENIFTLLAPRYIEELGQVQFTLRYNDSTYRRDMAKTMGVATDELKDELFTFVLRDSYGNYYNGYEFIREEKYEYVYYRLIFNGIKDFENVGKLQVFAYSTAGGEEVDMKQPSDSVIVYQTGGLSREYVLGGKEKYSGSVSEKLASANTKFIESETEE